MSAARKTVAVTALALACSVVTSHAYTGGPARAEIVGYEPSGHKVFYRLHFYDESGKPPEVYCFDLNDSEPAKAFRARDMEQTTGWSQKGWRVRKRLLRLRGVSDFDLKLVVRADSVGINTSWDEPQYQIRATVELESRHRTVDLLALCDPLVRVRGVYLIPGRMERIVVISYIGRVYRCEETDLPILIP